MDSFLQEMRINSFSFKVTIIHCLILWRKLSLSARYSPYTKFACCLYILTNASRHVNLSYYGGLRWRMGCEVRGRGEGCSWHRSVCVCGHVNLAEAWDEKIHSPIPLFPGDCTSQFTLGGVFRSAAMHLPSKGRISGEHATGFVFSRGMAQFSYLLQQRLKLGFSEWSES